MLRNSLLVLALLASAILHAQPQASKWYFGNGAGIDFSGPRPTPLSDGELFTSEGCSSISDANGKLLFYTDGITVWNSSHAQMVDGGGLNGHRSATQSALIAPKPGAPDYYYIFTVGEKANESGLAYSVVDMKGGRGQGKVIRKNVPLLRGTTEKLIAVTHTDNTSFWLIAHQWNSNGFFAYHVTDKGVGKPVVSRVGPLHRDAGSGNNGESIGQMCGSASGKRIALVQTYHGTENLQLYNFDASTGTVSTPKAYTIPMYAYGVAFSPNEQLLYVSYLKGQSGVVQYDLASNAPERTGKTIAYGGIVSHGSLAYGPDGRLYCTKIADNIDAISKPNVKGNGCGYLPAAIKFNSRYAAYGLPNALWTIDSEQPQPKPQPEPVVQTQAVEPPPTPPTPAPPATEPAPAAVNLGPDTTLCAERYTLDPGIEGSAYRWSNGAKSPTITVFSSGTYTVTVTTPAGDLTDEVEIEFDGAPVRFNYLPTFRPGSKVNNVFDFTLRNVTDFRLRVWNEKGKLVYETTNIEQRWKGKLPNGKPAPSGKYQWQFDFTPICPATGPETRHGSVTLIRHKE